MKRRSIFNNHHIILFYNSANSHDKKCYAAAKSMDTEVMGVDLKTIKVKSMEWLKLADLLKLPLDELISKKHPNFLALYGDSDVDLDTMSALKILQNHPETLIYPIAVKENHAILLKSKHEIYRLTEEA